LCQIADHGGAAVKSTLADQLYVPGQPISRPLAGVAGLFGKNVGPLDSLNELAAHAAKEIRLQVQRLRPDEEPAELSERMMVFNKPVPNGKLVVTTTQLFGVQAIAQNRQGLSLSVISDVVNAMLDMSRDRDNFCSNREALLNILIQFEDSAESMMRN